MGNTVSFCMAITDTDVTMEHSAPTPSEDHIDWRHGPALPENYPRTMRALMAECVERLGQHVVMIDDGTTASWRDLDEWSSRLASAWAPLISPGAHCAILVPNGLPHFIAELACWRLGAIAVPIFLGYACERIAALVDHVEPTIALVDDTRIIEVLNDSIKIVRSTDLWNDAKNKSLINCDRDVHQHTPCLIQFTSGSTGLPRGVVLTHGNLASQQAAFALHWPDVGPGDKIAGYLPWHHSFGGLAERLWAVSRGVTMTLVPGGGRDRALLVKTMREVAPTLFMSVPKIHALMVQENVFTKKSLKWTFTAGAPLPAHLHRWYADHDIPICEGWGLTETSPSCTLTKPGTSIPGVVGWPIAGVSVGIRQADSHIVVRGPNVMAGYFKRESPCLQDTILDSGDLGTWSDHGLHLRGRADHQLKIGNGEKVCAASLEAALEHIPAIHHVIVGAEPELVAIIELHKNYTAADALAAVTKINDQQTIPYYRIGEVVLLHEAMTIDNHMLTASHKVSRGQVLMAYRQWQCDGGPLFRRL